jgi:hypothetical protein
MRPSWPPGRSGASDFMQNVMPTSIFPVPHIVTMVSVIYMLCLECFRLDPVRRSSVREAPRLYENEPNIRLMHVLLSHVKTHCVHNRSLQTVYMQTNSVVLRHGA